MPKTVADRLHDLIKVVAPVAHAMHADTGAWPNLHPNPGEDTLGNPIRHTGAPYRIDELSGDRRRVRVYSEEGDVVSGIGATVEAAVAVIEAKLAKKEGQ
jgi:hypothetical protein